MSFKAKIGMLFPGQSSQYLGMGKEFYDKERLVQEMFENASQSLKENFVHLCFASSEQALRGTLLTQTGIFLISACIFEVLKQKYGIIPDLVAGHSLGEYTAVYAAGGFNFFDALYLLAKRGTFMQQAINTQNGGMLAIMNLPREVIEQICQSYDQPDVNTHVAELAVFNSPTQLVVSGTIPELEQIMQDVNVMRGKAVLLPVQGAFHCRLLRTAENQFAAYLLKVDFAKLQIPLVNNILAQKITSPESVKLSIVRQTSSHIYWWESMRHFAEMDVIIQVGPNDLLAKMLRREWPDKPIFAVNSPTDVEVLLTYLRDNFSS